MVPVVDHLSAGERWLGPARWLRQLRRDFVPQAAHRQGL